jgi:4-carboxymuconolactone decarboxylase
MDSDERYLEALAVVRRVSGEEMRTGLAPGEPDSVEDMHKIALSSAYVDSWTRTALDLRTRALVTVAIVATSGLTREIRIHTRIALNVGVTPDELVDLFIHLGVYAGAPRASAGWREVQKVLERHQETRETAGN